MDNAIIYYKTKYIVWRQDILKQSTAKYKAKFPDLGDMSHSNSLSSKDSGNTDFIFLICSVEDPWHIGADTDQTPFFSYFTDAKKNIFFLTTYPQAQS
jgi:hypothetical protein